MSACCCSEVWPLQKRRLRRGHKPSAPGEVPTRLRCFWEVTSPRFGTRKIDGLFFFLPSHTGGFFCGKKPKSFWSWSLIGRVCRFCDDPMILWWEDDGSNHSRSFCKMANDFWKISSMNLKVIVILLFLHVLNYPLANWDITACL